MADEWTLTERIGLPVWDGDAVVSILHKFPGDTVTREEFVTAKQSDEEIAMLVEYNTAKDEVTSEG